MVVEENPRPEQRQECRLWGQVRAANCPVLMLAYEGDKKKAENFSQSPTAESFDIGLVDLIPKGNNRKILEGFEASRTMI